MDSWLFGCSESLYAVYLNSLGKTDYSIILSETKPKIVEITKKKKSFRPPTSPNIWKML